MQKTEQLHEQINFQVHKVGSNSNVNMKTKTLGFGMCEAACGLF